MCIHQCNSDELQLFNDKPLRSGQEAILHCEAFGGNPRATLHWLKVDLSIYLSSTTPLSIYLPIHPQPRHLSSTTPLSIWKKDGERIDTTYETPSQYKAVNEHRSVFKCMDNHLTHTYACRTYTHKINIFFDWLSSYSKIVFDCALHLSFLINSINTNWTLSSYQTQDQNV